MLDPVCMPAPASKSQTQRALMLGALARGQSVIERPLDCDDSRALRSALRALGVEIQEQPERWLVRGGELRAPAGTIDCRDGGTTARFLAPLCLLLDAPLLLDASPRLRERPWTHMVEALQALGAHARYLGTPGRLPVALSRDEAPRSQRIAINASQSSQFASALLLVGPLLPHGLCLELAGQAVSKPYLDLTVHMMCLFGAKLRAQPGSYELEPGGYQPTSVSIEGDWSAAAFLLAAAFISGRRVELERMAPDSAQGDRAIVAWLRELELPGHHELDLTDCPDLVAPLAAAAAFASGPVELCGLRHARLKESDRLQVLARELGRAGVHIRERDDGLRIDPGGVLRPAVLDPSGDHRMAMAFGLLSLREPGIVCLTPECVHKSYPGYWEDLAKLR